MSSSEWGTVTANGLEVPLSEGCNLESFLRSQGLPPRSVVVELNGVAVAPSCFAQTPVRSGDRLEIVRVVAGG